MFIVFNQIILFSGIYPEEVILYLHKGLFRKMFAVLFTVMRNNTNVQQQNWLN